MHADLLQADERQGDGAALDDRRCWRVDRQLKWVRVAEHRLELQNEARAL